MHRARSIAHFRSFDPAEDAFFDSKSHVKALRDSHEEYEARIAKTIEEFEQKMTATPAEAEDHLDWITGKFEDATRAHKKAAIKMAKAMCKAAFGEDEPADEAVLEILQAHLASYIPEPLQRAVFQKVGAQISAATKKKLGEAHEHMKAAVAIVEALHGGLKDDDGEERRSIEDAPVSSPAPKTQRSKPSEAPRRELNDFLFAKELVKEITTAAQRGLETLNRRGKQ
jgi:hypothetical protein